jgi:hypothetical protein
MENYNELSKSQLIGLISNEYYLGTAPSSHPLVSNSTKVQLVAILETIQKVKTITFDSIWC